jgi:homocysteine S-methyltransferase
MGYAQLKARLDRGEVIVLDGGTGTELQRRGAPMDPAAWCGAATLHNDALLTEIHRDYIAAGAEVVTANTFASNRLMLRGAGLADRAGEINTRAVEAALKARDDASCPHDVVVAGSLSHMVPVSEGTADVDLASVPPDDVCLEAYVELAGILKAAGVDLIMLEMMYHPGRVRLAVEAARSTGLPVWFGASARRGTDGRILSFHHADDVPLEEIADLIPAGVDVAGCMHTGAEVLGEANAILRTRFGGPLSAYPDSGYFEMPDWQFVDTIEPDRLGQFYDAWIQEGARVIGGCCGLTVEHVRAAAAARDRHRTRGEAR